MTPDAFIAAMYRKERALKRLVYAAETESAQEAKAMLVQRSSGTLKTRTLRKLGHPYGHSTGAKVMRFVGSVDPTIINAQSGQFRRRWKVLKPAMQANVLRSSAISTDPKSKYMFGTKKMVARRLDIYVAARMKARRRSRLQEAVRSALRA